MMTDTMMMMTAIMRLIMLQRHTSTFIIKKVFFFFRKKSLISVPVHHPSTSRTQKVNICLKKGRLFKAKNRFFKTNLGFFYFDPQPIDVFCFFLKKRFFGTFPNLNGDDGDNEGNDIPYNCHFFYTDNICVRIKFTPKNADFSR